MSINRTLSQPAANPFSSEINRRNFLRTSAAAAAFGFVTRSGISNAFGQTLRNFTPVKVSHDRVIREVVGLRPFRPEGFLVEAQRVGDKLLVHNYGHGGAGITLSWGTAAQAVDLVRDFSPPQGTKRATRARPTRFAVIGCGVNGLSTAIMIQRRYSEIAGTV